MAPPIRTLHVEAAEDGTHGGSHRSLLDLVRGLPERGVQPTVLFYARNALIPEFEKAGAEVIVWEAPRRRERNLRITAGRFRRSMDALAAIWRRRRLLASLRVDLVHLNNSPLHGYDDWLPAARSLGIPCVASMRGDARVAPGPVVRQAARLYSRVIPVSRYVGDSPLATSLPRGRVQIIYNGFDRSRVPDPARRATLRSALCHTLGIPGDHFLAAMAGTIRRWKGQVQVVRAVALLPESLRGRFRLFLAGGWGEEDHDYVEEVRAAIAEHGLAGHVALLGHREDVPEIFSAADVAIHASVIPEPFGLVVVEALGTTTPVLAANAGGPVEILTQGGGFLHDPHDPAELAGHLERLMTDPGLLQEKTREAASVASRFCIERTRGEMAAMFRQVAAGG